MNEPRNRADKNALRARIRPGHRSGFLVGAAIGTGMAANFAVRGGADFLLALSAGRIRSMGEPSLVAMLPIHECNSFVMDFATREILPRAAVPVFFGASVFDPREDLHTIVNKVVEQGFFGIANFPTAILVDPEFRELLEEAGVGFSRELDMLSLAHEAGLATIAYVHNGAEAERAAMIPVDVINVDLGWNKGGVAGVSTEVRIEEAALHVASVVRRVRAISPQTLCMVEGGPIVSPRHLEELCRVARVDGYIGGSTIDRVPLETAIEIVTASFKTIESLRDRVERLEHSGFGNPLPSPLLGRSDTAAATQAIYNRLLMTDLPVLIVASPKSGAREVAEALHAESARRQRDLILVNLGGKTEAAQALELFGGLPVAVPDLVKARLGWLEVGHKATLLLHDLEMLPLDLQRALAEVVRTGRMRRLGEETSRATDVRLIGIMNPAHPNTVAARSFFEQSGFATIVLAPLNERLEDLPILIETALAKIRLRTRRPNLTLEPSAYRLLLEYAWPGDIAELQTVLENAALSASGDVLSPLQLEALVPAQKALPMSAFASERDWILDGLRRNRFRRGATAQFLGLSRKTLYNKMSQYNLTQLAKSD
ncbi:sigma-54-dependent Fis family transcriptional regulator [Neorhizobium sp. P12A]|uniref:phosphoenolpyruvate hydrolase family protein n=1 Tax=Neorhizobium sp. P12A TaxID=2268027 RepID=UPI0011EEC58B|nr:phosphoenolpyruvate hydrolase family protein [Neorhizobium sp. P12A]KAA0688122.1 sigma-54-dependent Fis family transcriptional regulator [Neorhizobium sp. P12A]